MSNIPTIIYVEPLLLPGGTWYPRGEWLDHSTTRFKVPFKSVVAPKIKKLKWSEVATNRYTAIGMSILCAVYFADGWYYGSIGDEGIKDCYNNITKFRTSDKAKEAVQSTFEDMCKKWVT